jgi:hypothetical protein
LGETLWAIGLRLELVGIEWTGRRTTDPETFSTVLQAKGESVSVDISQEVIDDHGEEAAKAVAAKKIVDETADGKPPKRVAVRTADFARPKTEALARGSTMSPQLRQSLITEIPRVLARSSRGKGRGPHGLNRFQILRLLPQVLQQQLAAEYGSRGGRDAGRH